MRLDASPECPHKCWNLDLHTRVHVRLDIDIASLIVTEGFVDKSNTKAVHLIKVLDRENALTEVIASSYEQDSLRIAKTPLFLHFIFVELLSAELLGGSGYHTTLDWRGRSFCFFTCCEASIGKQNQSGYLLWMVRGWSWVDFSENGDSEVFVWWGKGVGESGQVAGWKTSCRQHISNSSGRIARWCIRIWSWAIWSRVYRRGE